MSWIAPGLNLTLLCHGGFWGATFLLRRTGDDQFLEVAEAQNDVKATFSVHQAGNYSCSYWTHSLGTPSEPSATVTVEDLGECVDHSRSFLGEEVPGDRSAFTLSPNPEHPCPGLGNSWLDHSGLERHSTAW